MESRQNTSHVVAAAAPIAPIPAPGLVFVGISMVLGLAYALLGVAG